MLFVYRVFISFQHVSTLDQRINYTFPEEYTKVVKRRDYLSTAYDCKN